MDVKTPSPSGASLSFPDREYELTLLARLLTDEPLAWRDFDRSYGRLITATIARILSKFGMVTGSEDVHEVRSAFLLELLANGKSKLRAFSADRGVRLSTWISMLASHSAYDFLRKRRKDPVSEFEWDADTLSSDTPDPYSLCETSERIRLVTAVMSEFSAKDREFLELYFGDGLPPEEVASRMRISVKTVYTKKHKITGRLGALLTSRALAA